MPSTAYPHKEAYELWTGLQAEFARYHRAISFIPTSEIRLQDDLRRYLCLRCAGFLEKLVHECLSRYLATISGGPALAFSQSFFKQSPNLNAESFAKLVARFGEDHERRFRSFLTTTLKDSLDDLASVRNPIAHGDKSGGQKLDPERYRRLCQAVYEWFTTEWLTPTAVVTFHEDSFSGQG